MKRSIIAACVLVALTGCGATSGADTTPSTREAYYVEFKTERGVWCVQDTTSLTCDFKGFNAQEDK